MVLFMIVLKTFKQNNKAENRTKSLIEIRERFSTFLINTLLNFENLFVESLLPLLIFYKKFQQLSSI